MPTQALSLCQEILICVSQVLRNNSTHVLLLWDCSQIILTQYWLAMFFLRIYIYMPLLGRALPSAAQMSMAHWVREGPSLQLCEVLCHKGPNSIP